MKISLTTRSEAETFALAASLGAYLRPDTLLLLDGDLAAGKTVFAKGIGKGLGVAEHIKSPSYTLLCIYRGRLPLYHFDVYNLDGPDDFYDLGFAEYLEDGGVTLIEWAEVIAAGLDVPGIAVTLAKDPEDDDLRRLTLAAADELHVAVLKEWQEHEGIGI